MSEHTNKHMEQLFLSQVNRPDVKQFAQKKSMPYRELMSYYRCAMMEVETKFSVLNEELSMQYDRNPIETIKTRLKSPESILEKCYRKGISVTTESIEQNLFDIAGVRVICSFPSDIYMLSEAFLKQDDIVLIAKKDYIEHPKDNGYRSLHLIVEVPIFLEHKKKMMKVEVQLRTIAMDFWASLEHKIKYKPNGEINEDVSKELVKCARDINKLDNKMIKLFKK